MEWGRGRASQFWGSSLCQGPCLGNFVCFDPDRAPPPHYKGTERTFRAEVIGEVIFLPASFFKEAANTSLRLAAGVLHAGAVAQRAESALCFMGGCWARGQRGP